jgi:hypothetical protein
MVAPTTTHDYKACNRYLIRHGRSASGTLIPSATIDVSSGSSSSSSSSSSTSTSSSSDYILISPSQPLAPYEDCSYYSSTPEHSSSIYTSSSEDSGDELVSVE